MILSILGIAESTSSKKSKGKYQTYNQYIAETVVAFTPKMVISYQISKVGWAGVVRQ